jgi:hypothetical protein
MSGRKLIYAVAGVAAFIGTGVGAALLGSGSGDRGTNSATNTSQGACVDTWFGECLSLELEKLAEQDPQAALEKYEQQATANGRVREVCHQLFHLIGAGASRSTKTPWEVFILGSSECNWGYVHGAVEGYLQGDIESVISRAGALCSIPEGIEGEAKYIESVAGNCVHGTGHALFHANENPFEAETGCRRSFQTNQQALDCIDGMIMEFGNSDAAKAGKYANLCQKIGEDAKETCYRNIALTWFYQSNGDYAKVLNQCREASTEDLIYTCTWGAGNLFTVQQGFDLDSMTKLCGGLDGVYLRGCYTGAAVAGALGVNTRVLTTDELESFIDGIGESSLQENIRTEISKAEGGFGESGQQ